MQSIDYHTLTASLEKRHPLFAPCRMYYVLASLENRQKAQIVDYQILIASLEK